MQGIREQASLLLERGHIHAFKYPIQMVRGEAEMVTTRINRLEVTRAVLNQLAIHSLFSQKAGDKLNKEISRLNDG